MAICYRTILWVVTFLFASFCAAQTDMSLSANTGDVLNQDDSLVASGVWALLQLILVLIAVIALAYLVLHKGVGFFIKKTQENRSIQIKERVALDQKRYLYLVHVENKRFLLGGGDSGVSLISELSTPVKTQTEKTFSFPLNQGASQFNDKAFIQTDSKLHAES